MAIKPEDAEKLRPSIVPIVRRLENIIDSHIKDMYSNDHTKNLRWTIPSGTDQRIVSNLIELYRRAGWNVDYESPERGEPYLSFLPAKPKKDYGSGRPVETL